MIKNKVNPVAAKGTSSCEGVREKTGGRREREGAATLRSLGLRVWGRTSCRQVGKQEDSLSLL